MKRPEPKFKVGQWVRIGSGLFQDYGTPIRLRIWNKKTTQWAEPGWFYKTNYGIQREGNLIASGDRRGWHYDSQGYCDNPGRGY